MELCSCLTVSIRLFQPQPGMQTVSLFQQQAGLVDRRLIPIFFKTHHKQAFSSLFPPFSSYVSHTRVDMAFIPFRFGFL